MGGLNRHWKARIQHCGYARRSLYLRNEIDSHFSLGGFDGRISLAGWDGVALAEELEMVNERLHALFHRGTGWRHELVVVNADGTLSDFVQTLGGSLDQLQFCALERRG